MVPLATHGWLFLTVILMGLCLAIPAAIAWQRDRFDAFEIVHVLGFRYVLFFGIGALWVVADPYEVAYDMYLLPYIPTAALYCLLGYMFLLGGYYGPWFRCKKPRLFEDMPTGASVLLVPGLLGVVGREFRFADRFVEELSDAGDGPIDRAAGRVVHEHFAPGLSENLRDAGAHGPAAEHGDGLDVAADIHLLTHG